MEESKAVMLGILFHFIGDYLIQNNWVAQNKTKRFLPAFIHAITYSLLFLYLVNFYFWLPILITHYFIDRYRLAQYWIKLVNWNFKSDNWGFEKETPVWLSTWLMIIVDNIFHILINTSIIIWYFNR